MGRNQSFESAAVVRVARDLFWDKGYDATSVADLEQATGITRSSLYHAFGSKRGLYDTAVDNYLETVIRPRLSILRADHAQIGSGLLEYFAGLQDAVLALPDGSARLGCLLVNCAAGLAGHDEAARTVVDSYRAELTAALRYALAASIGTRRAPEPELLDERARVLASLSMTAMLLARINREESVAMLATALDHIRAWISLPGGSAPEASSRAPHPGGRDAAPTPAGDSVLG